MAEQQIEQAEKEVEKAAEEAPKHAPLITLTLYQCGNPECNFATTRLRAFFHGKKTTSDFMGTYEVPNLICPVCGMHIDDGR